MPEVRYSIPGVEPDPAKGISAFAPHYNRPAGSGAQSYKYAVTGRPGTHPIPVPARRETQMSPDYGDLANAGTARSSDAPDAIYPNQYYQGFIAEFPGGCEPHIRRYNPTAPGATALIPIPAEDGRAAYLAGSAALSRRAVLNRARPMPQFSRQYAPPTGTWNG